MNVAFGLSTVALGVVDEAWWQWHASLHFRAAKKDFVWSPSNEAPRAPSPWDRLAFARRVDSRSTKNMISYTWCRCFLEKMWRSGGEVEVTTRVTR